MSFDLDNKSEEKDIKDILLEMLCENKITNLHLSKMTGEEFTEEDIEDNEDG
tara:strand:- start:87 stop:242 length:156 start_codon:yes stop_codon:yes gene_type:complete